MDAMDHTPAFAPMQSAEDIWASVLSVLKRNYPQTVYNLWFAPTKVEHFDGHNLVISIDSDMKRDVIEKQYYAAISSLLFDILGFEVLLSFCSTQKGPWDPELYPPAVQPGEPIPPIERTEPPVVAPPIYANAEYTFDNFIISESNKFAQAASFAVASNPADAYNPLFIHGGSGLGKTHLLYAIMNYIQQNYPSLSILYVKGEEFTYELIDSIRHKSQPAFRQKYRSVDVLLIDDIQFIAGKESIQDEFFHTFNALFEDHRQIILAADRPPRDMRQLEDRLKSRFEWGLLADIQPPDYELRVAILQSKAQMMGKKLPQDVLRFLAENLRSNVRQLEGAVKKICAQSFITGEPIDMELAKRCTAELVGGEDTDPIKAEKLIRNVAKKYGVSVEDILGRRRVAEISNARHISIYLIRRATELSLPSIGQIFDRDHSTIMSSISTVEKLIQKNPLLEAELKELMKI